MSTLVFAIAFAGWFLGIIGGHMVPPNGQAAQPTALGLMALSFTLIMGAFAWATW